MNMQRAVSAVTVLDDVRGSQAITDGPCCSCCVSSPRAFCSHTAVPALLVALYAPLAAQQRERPRRADGG
jgi:hypothetical protein